MSNKIFDPTFGIKPQALAVANLLNLFETDQPNLDIKTFPYYNGCERGICLIINPIEYSKRYHDKIKKDGSKPLAIFFCESHNSDDLFIQTQELEEMPLNTPSREDKTFNDQSYYKRRHFTSHQYYETAKYIADLIKKYSNNCK